MTMVVFKRGKIHSVGRSNGFVSRKTLAFASFFLALIFLVNIQTTSSPVGAAEREAGPAVAKGGVASIGTFGESASIGSFARWSKVEVQLLGPASQGMSNTTNPFQVPVEVTFAGPGGTFVVPAFYDGDGQGGLDGNLWKVRFSPNAAGTWTYTSQSPNALLDGYSGTFQVTEPTGCAAYTPGGLPEFRCVGRLESVGEHYLKFADGPYWLKGGADEPEDFLASGQNVGFRSKEVAIDYLSSKGVNSLYLMTHNIGGDGQNVWPWVGSTQSEAQGNTRHFDLNKMAQWEEWFDYMQSKGLVIHLVLEDDSGWTGFDRDLYYREIIARFGHYNGLYWNISEEYNENYGGTQIKGFAQTIGDLDAYDHPITVHHQGSLSRWDPFVGDSRFGLTSFQKNNTPYNSAAAEWFQKVADSGRTIPIAFDETSSLGAGARDLTRKIVWSVYLGGANFEMLTRPLTTYTDFAPHFEDMTRARGFIESLPFWQMRPSNSLLTAGTGYVFAQAGEAYAVYLPDGGSINLDLSSSTNSYLAEWFNPRDGATQAIGPVAGGGVRSFTAPDNNDWALLLRRNGVGGNVAPTVSAQAAGTPVDTPRDLTLSYTDPDGPGPYTFSIDALPSHGVLSGSGADRRYTPAAGYTGTDSFRWQVNDGLADSPMVSFDLTVSSSAQNLPAVAQDQNLSMAQDNSAGLQLAYTDPDGPGPYAVTILQQPVRGTLTGSNNDRTYTPSPGYSGADTFTWKVNDGRTDSNDATVSVQVTGVGGQDCSGHSLSTMTCFTEQSGVIAMEAENYTSQSGYADLAVSGASGGKAMQVGSSGHLDFEASFAQSGRWNVWIRTQAHDHEMNGMFLELDGVRQVAPSGHVYAGVDDIYLVKGTTWSWTPQWQAAGEGNHAGPVTIDLTSPGFHTISIVNRGSERPWVDKIVLTKDPTPPVGTGPAETIGNPSANTPPTVDAGSDQDVTLPAEAFLKATVTDDGLPDPSFPVITSWSKVSGAGTVIFGNASAVETTATFSQGGVYVLRLTADDGEVSSFDDLTVTVSPAPGTPATGEPLVISQLSAASGRVYQVVNGGLESGARVYIDRSYTYTTVPASHQDAVYVRTANDDKTFTQESFLSFTVNQDVTVHVGYDSRASALPNWLASWANTGEALISTDTPLGLYSQSFSAGPITLGANNAPGAAGAHSNYTVAIVGGGSPVNEPPVVSASGDAQVTMPAAANLIGTVIDDGLPTTPGIVTTHWSMLSGPLAASVTFGTPTAPTTTATFEPEGAYVLEFTADDGLRTSRANVSVTVLGQPALASITVGPTSASVLPGGSVKFTAMGLDQYGDSFQIDPMWEVSGGGSIDQSGLLTAGTDEHGPFTVTASHGLVSGTTTVSTVSTGGTGDAGDTGVTGGRLVLSDLTVASDQAYRVLESLEVGESVYIDRNYTYTGIPAMIQGEIYVQTANNDKTRTETPFLSFSVNQDVTVYVAYDSRASSLPGWLSGWANIGRTLGNTDVALDLYYQDFVAGPITLGANFASGAAGASSNYTVVIVGNPTATVGPVVISSQLALSDQAYQVAEDLSAGDLVYNDRSYTYTDVPPVIDGALYLKTANDDKTRSEPSYLTFSVNQAVTVYVAYDSRATSLPAWLVEWSSTGSSLINTDVLLDLYSKDFAAGPITLGGNMAAGAAGASSNYSVAIVPR